MEDGIGDGRPAEKTPQAMEAVAENAVPELIPELGHGHAHHGHGSGVPWLDVIVGLSAVFISVVSLVVSIAHGKTMEKMVDQNQKLVVASTMPLLSIVGRNVDETGKPMIQVTLSNGGVGPAIIGRFEVRYKGVLYTSEADLMRACCAASWHKAHQSVRPKIYYSNISGFILPARQDLYPITIKPDQNGMDLYKAFNTVRDSDDLTYHACYCSVLDECWETDFDHKRPQPVAQCKVDPNEKLW
jgi:hypothetical protein